MAEDVILCHQCGKDLVMKFIELKDLVFCSSTCFENFKNKMGENPGNNPCNFGGINRIRLPVFTV